MTDIFISYRRDDAGGWPGRLAEDLRHAFPGARVFQDVAAIRAGEDFTVAIAEALASCEVLVALIGPRWLAAAANGRPRIDDPDDLVRREIAAALARPIHVVPVLLGGARMPGEAALPEDLRPLARRQAHEMTEARWDHDRSVLLDRLGELLGTRPAGDRGTARPGKVSVAQGLVIERDGAVDEITGVAGEATAAPDVEVLRDGRIAGEVGAITGVDARPPPRNRKRR